MPDMIIGQREKITYYCECGSYFRGEGKVSGPFSVWVTLHSGEGHGPTNAERSWRARRKADREANDGK